MDQEDEIYRLEQFVEKLLEDYQTLKAENITLRSQLADMEKINQQSQKMVSNLKNDRSTIHERVTGMIGKMEKWEKAIKADKKKKSSRKAKTPVDVDPTIANQTFTMGVE